jgi:hypothetical protein
MPMLHFRRFLALVIAGAFATTAASGATFIFDSDPFENSTALTTPGRQIVGGEPTIVFDPVTDQFIFDPAVFNVGSSISFANDVVGNLATSGLNVIVLETLDNDADITTPFGAGNAANLLAGQITADGAGFFIYFNSGLDLPRLVYSTNLNAADADLAVLARMSNLAGNPASLTGFTSANFEIAAAVPEPASWAMMLLGFAAVGAAIRMSRRKVAPVPAGPRPIH